MPKHAVPREVASLTLSLLGGLALEAETSWVSAPLPLQLLIFQLPQQAEMHATPAS
jgi:hypothetical protein